MEQVAIEAYQVSVRERAKGDQGTPRPALLLKGRADGVPTNVWIYFEGPNGDMISGEYLGLRFGIRDGSQKLSLRMNLSGFDAIYDVLRNEAPTFFLYDVKDAPNNPSGSTKLVTVAQIGTLDEPAGEGPADEDA